MKCTQPNCDRDAAITYAWPWGEQGAACAACLPALERTAESLGRPLPTSPVPRSDRDTSPPPPDPALDTVLGELELERGKVQRLEAELARHKQVNADLARHNAKLGTDLLQMSEALRALRQLAPAPAPAPSSEPTTVIEGAAAPSSSAPT